MINKPKIMPEERDKIAFLLASKISLREIARELGRSVSSISEEVKRNSFNGEYTSIAAQRLSEQRNKTSRRINPLKSPQVYAYVIAKLRCGWSPEQIAGRLKRENKEKGIISCDPYCAWQKGSNENHNGVLRRYIPKKADLTDLYQSELNAIIEEINQRPRKCLGYETPKEAFTKELKLVKIQKCSDSH